MIKDNFNLIATCGFGLEGVLKEELKKLGFEIIQVENSRIIFKGSPEEIVKANLWLRIADRVLLEIGEFKATSFDELFEETKALPWADYIPQNGAFPAAKISSVRSKLFSKSDGQRIVKKAVADKLLESYKAKKLPETGAEFLIFIRILNDKVTLSIDTTGSGLHKRGYRKYGNEAPLRETLAAALVYLSKWTPERPFLDPMCGSGTILIEAAQIGKNIAPGLNKTFVSEDWEGFAPIYQKLRREAKEAENDLSFRLLGSDIDSASLKQARINADLAGVSDYIAFQKLDVSEISSKKKYGVLITNPPYGKRIGEIKKLKGLYQEMGKVFRRLPDWSYFILTAYPDFQKVFGEKATKNRKLYNAKILTYFYEYFGPLPPKRS